MRNSLNLFLFLVSIIGYTQTYSTTRQGSNNSAGGAYVAPTVTKTYTAPTTNYQTSPSSTSSYSTRSSSYNPSSSNSSSSNSSPSSSSSNSSNSRSAGKPAFGEYVETTPAKARIAPEYTYDKMYDVYEGFAIVRRQVFDENIKRDYPYMYGYANAKGEVVIPLTFTWAQNFEDGMAMVSTLEKMYVNIDTNGNEIKRSTLTDGMSSQYTNGLIGFVADYGTNIPAIYEAVHDFSGGLACVKLNGKWGFIDKTGKTIIPFLYDEGGKFAEELVAVKLNDKWGFINKVGKVIIPFQYEWCTEFSDGLALVKSDKKWGYIDKANKVIIPFLYYDGTKFRKGTAHVRIDEMSGPDAKWIPITKPPTESDHLLKAQAKAVAIPKKASTIAKKATVSKKPVGEKQ